MLILRVRCPKCGFKFNTTTVKRVRCLNCGKSFKVYYKEKKGKEWVLNHRVVGIVKGSKAELFRKVREAYAKSKRGEFKNE